MIVANIAIECELGARTDPKVGFNLIGSSSLGAEIPGGSAVLSAWAREREGDKKRGQRKAEDGTEQVAKTVVFGHWFHFQEAWHSLHPLLVAQEKGLLYGHPIAVVIGCYKRPRELVPRSYIAYALITCFAV